MTIVIISVIRDPWGGSEELWYQMARHALANGHRVIHMAYEHPEKHTKKRELEKMGLVALYRPGYIPPNAGRMKRYWHVGVNFLRKRLSNPFNKLKKYQPDVVIYNASSYTIKDDPYFAMYLFSIKYKFIYISQLCNDNVRSLTAAETVLVKQAFTKAAQVFFVSRKNMESARRQLAMELPQAQVVTNPVNIDDPELMVYPQSVNGGLLMASVANLHTNHKGQDLLLEALSKDIWRSRNWKLNFYGSGYDAEYVRELIRFYKLEEKVECKGRVADIKGIWAENQVLVISSHMEGMPLAVVEAMLCGRACLVTDVGGNEDWIVEGQNGFLCEAASVNSIARGLERLWNKRAGLECMGKDAHKMAMAKFDPDIGRSFFKMIS
jgi:L-malate glycosyltransferase